MTFQLCQLCFAVFVQSQSWGRVYLRDEKFDTISQMLGHFFFTALEGFFGLALYKNVASVFRPLHCICPLRNPNAEVLLNLQIFRGFWCSGLCGS